MLQLIINGLITGGLFSLMAIGFSLVYNTTKVFHIAAAGVWAFASYVYYLFSITIGLPVFAAIGIAVVISMALSLAIELIVYRPLYRKNASTGVMMIASIGVMTVIDSVTMIAFGSNDLTPKHVDGLGFLWHSLDFSADQCWQLAIGLPALIVLLVFLKRTGWGNQFRAISADEDLFASLGYNIFNVRTLAFVLSGCFVALSSCLYICGSQSVKSYTESLDFFVLALAAMVIGGTRRYGGCLIGGMIVGLAQEISNGIWKESNWLDIVVFGLTIIVLMFKTEGIMGHKQRNT